MTLEHRYGIRHYTPHRPGKFPIEWKNERIRVLRVQWNFTKFKEIAYDCSFPLLRDLVFYTGGFIVQRAVVETSVTKVGQMLISSEMKLPGVQESEMIPLGVASSSQQRKVPKYQPDYVPLTFLVGDWSGKIKLPAEAETKAFSIKMMPVYEEIRKDMAKRAKDAIALITAKEHRARSQSQQPVQNRKPTPA